MNGPGDHRRPYNYKVKCPIICLACVENTPDILQSYRPVLAGCDRQGSVVLDPTPPPPALGQAVVLDPTPPPPALGQAVALEHVPHPPKTWRLRQTSICRLPLSLVYSEAVAAPTWKWRMMVHMRPSVSLGLPSTMSSHRMFTSLICNITSISHLQLQHYQHYSAKSAITLQRTISLIWKTTTSQTLVSLICNKKVTNNTQLDLQHYSKLNLQEHYNKHYPTSCTTTTTPIKLPTVVNTAQQKNTVAS